MAALTSCIQLVLQRVRPSARWPELFGGGGEGAIGGKKQGCFLGGAKLTWPFGTPNTSTLVPRALLMVALSISHSLGVSECGSSALVGLRTVGKVPEPSSGPFV